MIFERSLTILSTRLYCCTGNRVSMYQVLVL